jgi:hypothetical protein
MVLTPTALGSAAHCWLMRPSTAASCSAACGSRVKHAHSSRPRATFGRRRAGKVEAQPVVRDQRAGLGHTIACVRVRAAVIDVREHSQPSAARPTEDLPQSALQQVRGRVMRGDASTAPAVHYGADFQPRLRADERSLMLTCRSNGRVRATRRTARHTAMSSSSSTRSAILSARLATVKHTSTLHRRSRRRAHRRASAPCPPPLQCATRHRRRQTRAFPCPPPAHWQSAQRRTPGIAPRLSAADAVEGAGIDADPHEARVAVGRGARHLGRRVERVIAFTRPRA